MKTVQNLLLLIAGALLCLAVQGFLKPRPAHAADQLGSGTVCTAQVPAEWGEFRGSSIFGIAFEDDNGTLRFVAHPPCGTDSSSNPLPAPTVDLLIERKPQ